MPLTLIYICILFHFQKQNIVTYLTVRQFRLPPISFSSVGQQLVAKNATTIQAVKIKKLTQKQ